MANYKVPQDVEADDKIIGPFSFRQFIYLIIVALAGGLTWVLGKVFLPLAIIPMPIVIFFGALALPLRKDQPMEIFLAAMVSFYLKPHKRLWDPDGVDSLIEITAPKTPEVQRVKDITQDEAQRRLKYLSEIVDSKGWAVRGIGTEPENSAMTSDAYFAAQQTEDILDDDSTITKMIDSKIDKSNSERKSAMAKVIAGQPTDYFNGPVAEPETAPDQTIDSVNLEPIDYNPYPDIQQSVIQPLDEVASATPPTPAVSVTAATQTVEDINPIDNSDDLQPSQKTPTTSAKAPSADIINLATNDDLSIATIAREANRIHEKQDLNDGVVISWR